MLRQATQNLITALYPRLSHEDELQGESNSISNQKGYSKPLQNRMALPTCAGTPTTAFPARTSSAPVFKPCLQTLKPGKWVRSSSGHEPVRAKLLAGRVLHGNAVPQRECVLSLSTTMWTAQTAAWTTILPSAKSVQRMAGERYEQENQSSKTSKGMSGKPVTSKPVYGYLMDEDENYLVDEETAPVVQQIYQLCLAGNGPTKIARMLTEQQILRRERWNTAGRAAPAATTPAMSANGRRTPLFISSKTGSTPAVW